MSFFRKLFGLDKSEKAKIPAKETRQRVEISMEAQLVYANQQDPIYKERLDVGLLPGEIILLNWLNGKSAGKVVPEYFEYVFCIDHERSKNNLISLGYIKTADPSESLIGLKVDELKLILKNNNLPMTGKKDILISRIIEHLPEEKISQYINGAFYIVTACGAEVLAKHEYILFAHSFQRAGSVGDIIRFVDTHNMRNSTIEEIYTSFLISGIKSEFTEHKNYGLVRNGFLGLAEIQKKFKHKDNAVVSFICMFIFDVSGWANNNDFHENNVSEIDATIAPRLIGEKIESVRLEGYFNKAWAMTEHFFPRHYLGKEKTFECLVAGFEGDIESIRRLLNLENRKKRDFGSYEQV